MSQSHRKLLQHFERARAREATATRVKASPPCDTSVHGRPMTQAI